VDNLLSFCPIWGIEHIEERFCEGCGFLSNSMLNYCSLDSIRQETYDLIKRLEVGL